jgi:hypothetical protein
VSAEIVGPFNRYELVVDGWRVPFVEAREIDGGKIDWTIDHRLGATTSAADFEETARLVAEAVAVACGLPSHPSRDLSEDERAHYFRHVRHPAAAPCRMTALAAVESEPHKHDEDDPRRSA